MSERHCFCAPSPRCVLAVASYCVNVHVGIFAGHDYFYQGQMPCKTNQDWAVNYDGTRDPLGRAVRGAVQEFARAHSLAVSVGTGRTKWPSWAIVKPGGDSRS